jgi:hypothetical protein
MTPILAIDLVLIVTLLEWPLLLLLTRRHRSHGLLPSFSPWCLLQALLPGLCLLCVARVLSSSEPEPLIFPFLALAGVFHGLDLWQRFKREVAA